jgi:hypothetical protein
MNRLNLFLCLNCDHKFKKWLKLDFGHIKKEVCPDCHISKFLEKYKKIDE